MALKLNVHETLQELGAANLTAAARLALDELLQAVPPDEEVRISLDDLLQRNGVIAHTWCIADVRDLRPDLSDDQAWEVLEYVARRLDCELGISWTTLEVCAEELFPEPDDAGKPDEKRRQP
jgi:hypothetical protein